MAPKQVASHGRLATARGSSFVVPRITPGGRLGPEARSLVDRLVLIRVLHALQAVRRAAHPRLHSARWALAFRRAAGRGVRARPCRRRCPCFGWPVWAPFCLPTGTEWKRGRTPPGWRRLTTRSRRAATQPAGRPAFLGKGFGDPQVPLATCLTYPKTLRRRYLHVVQKFRNI